MVFHPQILIFYFCYSYGNYSMCLRAFHNLFSWMPKQPHQPWTINHFYKSCCSVARSCLTLCMTLDCSPLGFPVLHHLPEFAQTHVHWVSDTIQPSHPLLSPSPPALNLFPASGSFLLSQFFASGGQSTGVSASASVLPVNIQDWSPLGWTGWIPAVQGTLKSLLQHLSSKASVLRLSIFFTV